MQAGEFQTEKGIVVFQETTTGTGSKFAGQVVNSEEGAKKRKFEPPVLIKTE